MRGRKPVPTTLKILRGNPGQRPLNENEPMPSTEFDLSPPDYLLGDAATEWARVAPMLHEMGLLTVADLDALAIYCQTFARWKEAEKHISAVGMIIKSSSRNSYPMINPYLPIANKAQAQCTRMLAEFGLTPSARSRVTVAKKAKSATNKNERFFGGASDASKYA